MGIDDRDCAALLLRDATRHPAACAAKFGAWRIGGLSRASIAFAAVRAMPEPHVRFAGRKDSDFRHVPQTSIRAGRSPSGRANGAGGRLQCRRAPPRRDRLRDSIDARRSVMASRIADTVAIDRAIGQRNVGALAPRRFGSGSRGAGAARRIDPHIRRRLA
jgi:hypothetical protein